MANAGGFKYLAARYLELWADIEVGDGQLSGVAINGVVPQQNGGAYRHGFGAAGGFIDQDLIITAKAVKASPSDNVSLTVKLYQLSGADPVRLREREFVTSATFGANVEVPLALIIRVA